LKRTPLYEFHSKTGKLAEFAGYEMPLWYSSTVEEHLAVRNDSGIFDVSHMGRVTVRGADATSFLDSLVPTSVRAQPPGKSFYTLLLNSEGGIIDDLIIMKRDDGYMVVVNAANKTKDLDHIRTFSAPHDVEILDITDSSTMIAVQGPNALNVLQPLTSTDLSRIERHRHVESNVGAGLATVTRSGYTGEDGFEVILHESGISNNAEAMSVWTQLAAKSKPCGLGARDSLRTEAGLPLYGSDIDDTTNPFEADLSWVVTKGKSGYVGSERVANYPSAGGKRRLRRGIVLADKIPRHGFTVTMPDKREIGRVTSGTFSPILKKGIALAYIETAHSEIGEHVEVDVRGISAPGAVVKPPFYDQKLYGWNRSKQ
jgi:aminomethyltransferase